MKYLCHSKSILLVLLLIFIRVERTAAQGQANQSGSTSTPSFNFAPLSPEATALGKFGDIPVSLYTGVPNISIPIYEFKIKGLTIPISIDYHASGVKVDELATNVGLDWVLNAGGIINQTVYGLSDSGPTGWPFSSFPTPQTGFIPVSWPPNGSGTTTPYNQTSTYIFDNYTTQGLIDTQPDVFSYSFPGNSGKFFFDQSQAIHLMPYKNLNVTCTVSTNGSYAIGSFIITDERGNKFYFSYPEFTTTIASGCGSALMSSSTNTAISYYLSKIVTPNNEEVDFHYSLSGYTIQNQVGQNRYWESQQAIGNAEMRPTVLPECDITSSSSVSGLRLDYVTNIASGEKVVFNYNTARTDLPGTQSLDNIQVYNNSSATPVKSFMLTHDYFYNSLAPAVNNANNYRLRLTGIQQSGQQPYVFQYNSTLLPSRLSFAQDNWGYYNGALGNTTLLPNENSPYFSTGANRNPDTGYMKAGVLTKVTYPTGGSSTFDYEANSTFVNSYNAVYVNHSTGVSALQNQTRTVNFTVAPQSSNFQVQWTTTNDNNQGEPGGLNPNGDNTTITLTGPGSVYFPGAVGFSGNSAGLVNLFSSSSETAALAAGNYTLTITCQSPTGDPAVGGIIIYWKTEVSQLRQVDTLGGGLRVKAITNNPITGLATVKHFDYSDPANPGHSSGTQLYNIVYDYDYYRAQSYADVGAGYFLAPYIAQGSTSQTPLGSVQGQNVIYKDVAVYDGDKTQGYTLSEFITYGNGNTITPFSDPTYPSFPYAPLQTLDWLNGLPLKTTQYKYNSSTQTYFPLSINQKTYKTGIGSGGSDFYAQSTLPQNRHEYYVRGAKIVNLFPDANGVDRLQIDLSYPVESGLAESGLTQFAIGYYYLYSSWFHLDQETNTLYDANGLNPVVSTNNYYYDNPLHIQLTRSVTTKSDGKVLTALTTYPDDYAAGTTFLDDMKANHLTGFPVEKVSYQYDGSNNSILGGNITQYKTGGQGLTDIYYQWESATPVIQSAFKFSNSSLGQLPATDVYQAYSFDSRYTPRLTYSQYDNLGNPQQVAQVNGPPVTYLWGYNQQYPVAQVKNAAYSDVVNVLSQATINQLATGTPLTDVQLRSTLNALRTAPSLSSAQVSTYTFNPLVGMTSSTDPKGMTTYYEYDTFNRLMNIKDQNNNIVKNYCYNYAGQATNDCTIQNVYSSIAESGTFTKNDPPPGYTGTTVTYTVPAGTYTSLVSQSDANNQAINDVNTNGQAYANTHGTSLLIYNSAAASGTFTRASCGSGYQPTTVTYNIPAGAYTSVISQADADAKAVADVGTNGQAYANSNAGGCLLIYYSAAESGTFTRNNCGAGYQPTAGTYTVPASAYNSVISQADANNKAIADVSANGQNYVNSTAGCQLIYYSAAESGTFTRNNCGAGYQPTAGTYTVPASAYNSVISQADANNKAIADVSANGQNYVNSTAGCQLIYYSAAESGTFTRNNCGAGYQPTAGTYTVPASAYNSVISQADANNKAIADVSANGQNYVNSTAGCQLIYYSAAESGTFTRNNCGAGYQPTAGTYTVPASAYNSVISQADANNKAIAGVSANGQNYVNSTAGCQLIYYSVAKSGTFTRNNCSPGSLASTITYTALANSYNSVISQADADNKAIADVNANGQAYANATGTCTACSGLDHRVINNICELGSKIYTKSVLQSPGHYLCTYHYQWSDGSISPNYTESNTHICALEN